MQTLQSAVLIYACERFDRLDVVRLLAAGGVDVNGPGSSGRLPLHAAIRCGNVPCAELLLAAKADPCGSSKRSPRYVLCALTVIGLLCDGRPRLDCDFGLVASCR